MICCRVEQAAWATNNSTRPWCGRAWYGSAPPRGDKNEVARKALVTVTGRSFDETCQMLEAAVQVIQKRECAPAHECHEWIADRWVQPRQKQPGCPGGPACTCY
jgi:hypothetical protein